MAVLWRHFQDQFNDSLIFSFLKPGRIVCNKQFAVLTLDQEAWPALLTQRYGAAFSIARRLAEGLIRSGNGQRTIADLLNEQPFFREFSPEAQALIAGCAFNVHFADDQRILTEGAPADHFYVIRSGRVAVEVDDPRPLAGGLPNLRRLSEPPNATVLHPNRFDDGRLRLALVSGGRARFECLVRRFVGRFDRHHPPLPTALECPSTSTGM